MQTFELENYPLWTALVTPFTEQGDIDYTSLNHLVEAQAAANNGILLLGSTGEGLALTPAEQRDIVLHVCELAPEVPLMVAVGGFNLQQQLEWVRFCNELPIHAYLLGTPCYAKPGIVGQTAWFGALMDAADHPCMLYNVPSRSGVELYPETLEQLAGHPRLWSLKEASGSIAKFEAYRQRCPELAIYSGDDGLTPYFAQAGAVGLVSVCANAWPEATHQFVQQSLTGQGQALFPTWQQAIAPLGQVANPIPVKVLLHLQQAIRSPLLRPPLTHEEVQCTASLQRANQQIQDWLSHTN